MIIRGNSCNVVMDDQVWLIKRRSLVADWEVISLNEATFELVVIRANLSEAEADEFVSAVETAIEHHKSNPRMTPFDAVTCVSKKNSLV